MSTKKKAKTSRKPAAIPQDICSRGVFSPTPPNPNHIQFKLGKDEGRKEAQHAIEQDSPYHALLASKRKLNNLQLEKEHIESQLDNVKKAIAIQEEVARGLRNQVHETLK